MNATAMDRNHLHRMYGKQAPRYDRAMRFWKRVFDIRKGRAWARGDVRGDVLERGVGTGLNLPYYSEDVDLTAIDRRKMTLANPRMLGFGLIAAGVAGQAQDSDRCGRPRTLVC